MAPQTTTRKSRTSSPAATKKAEVTENKEGNKVLAGVEEIKPEPAPVKLHATFGSPGVKSKMFAVCTRRTAAAFLTVCALSVCAMEPAKTHVMSLFIKASTKLDLPAKVESVKSLFNSVAAKIDLSPRTLLIGKYVLLVGFVCISIMFIIKKLRAGREANTTEAKEKAA
mmetsp:Transcript_9169/g.15745  ORF Transcript_9169/g.15745 Transcript_9169/m.15745 type:complete len:169 (+) Transcript_9169:107-613(+)